MKTKTTPAGTQSVVYCNVWPGDIKYTTRVAYGASSITYDEGPQYNAGRCNWKSCYQTKSNSRSVTGSGWSWHGVAPWGNIGFTNWVPNVLTSGRYSMPDERNLYPELADQLAEKLDLNTSDAVLIYSGVLQAVPLLGGALKFTSIMNKAAKKLSKSFKRQPFTTVVKSLISLDFIDRFVVKPTIDDARKFADATNYVLRVLNTMHERNSMPVRYDAEATDERRSSEISERASVPVSSSDMAGDKRMYGVSYTRSFVTSKAFMLAEVAYETDAVSPIKLWAQRVGLTRPLDSVWDLVPFSFVIDYFTRAGDMISGLSDEMSSQDGLKGRIQRIHGLWGSTKCGNEAVSRYDRRGSMYYRGGSVALDVFEPCTIRYGSYLYRRTPMNPWLYQPFPSSDLIDVKLTKSRMKTLLELLVQAKA